jgi:7-cyano-7-deazaguanine synthase in queuosine biosynthesis
VTTLYLRTRPDEREPRSGLLLDWFGRGGASTISGSIADLFRDLGTPDTRAVDLLRLGVAVYGADKTVLRSDQPDRWTRTLRVHVPVANRDAWDAAAPRFMEALQFLTNDHWEVRFRSDPIPASSASTSLFGAEAVCLFSGGLDSLAGAIDLLEGGRSVVLVGHYDSNLLRPRQERLYERLRSEYGVDKVAYRPFYLRRASAGSSQARPLPPRREPTTRSRSFLFMSAAAVVMSTVGLDRVHVPENGYIGLNVPLEVSRLGACSTRTTHPYFMALMSEALAASGSEFVIENPYRLRTKGEVLDECRNRQLLFDLVPLSVSCAHPEVGRWRGEGYRNCGYCYPCLMRRSSLHHVGLDDASAYRVDIGEPAFLHGRGVRTAHLRALMESTRRRSRPSDVLRSGPLPRGEVGAFVDLYERGRAEVAAWLQAAVPASA